MNGSGTYNLARPQRWGFWMTCVWFGAYLLATQGFLTVATLMGYAHWQGLPPERWTELNFAYASCTRVDVPR